MVIPSKNSEKTIQASLESLFTSGIPVGTVYLIDKNSTDRTAKIALSFDKVKVVQEAHNYTEALITGTMLTKTEFIVIMDSDIILAKNFWENLGPIYKKYFITKGTYRNQLHPWFKMIEQKDVDFFKDTIGGFCAIIANRKTLLQVFYWIREQEKLRDLDSGPDTITYSYARKNKLPCHQDLNVVNLHQVFSLKRIWKNTIWYGRSARRAPIYEESSQIFIFRNVWKPIKRLWKYKDIPLLVDDIVRNICWVYGWLTG